MGLEKRQIKPVLDEIREVLANKELNPWAKLARIEGIVYRPKVLLTNKQKDILEFIIGYVESHGYSPALHEIAEHIGVSSLATVFDHLKAIRSKGYIDVVRGKGRGISICEGV